MVKYRGIIRAYNDSDNWLEWNLCDFLEFLATSETFANVVIELYQGRACSRLPLGASRGPVLTHTCHVTRPRGVYLRVRRVTAKPTAMMDQTNLPESAPNCMAT